jgi:hypothetical protein
MTYTVTTVSLDIWQRVGSTAELLELDLNALTKDGGRVVSVVPNPYTFGPDRMSVLVVVERASP